MTQSQHKYATLLIKCIAREIMLKFMKNHIFPKMREKLCTVIQTKVLSISIHKQTLIKFCQFVLGIFQRKLNCDGWNDRQNGGWM